MRTNASDSSHTSNKGSDTTYTQIDDLNWASDIGADLASSAWTKTKEQRSIDVYRKDEERQGDDTFQMSATEPCRKLSESTSTRYRPTDSKENYRSAIPRHYCNNDAKQLSDTAETCGTLLIGAVCSKKFSYEILESKEKTLTLAERSEARSLGTAHAFSSILAASAAECALDNIVDPNGRKAAYTVTADWLITPLLSVCRQPWLAKVALMLVSHALGRFLDDKLR